MAFTLDGRDPELVLEEVKPVGYHAWIDDHTLALFVLGTPATLRLADTHTGKAEEVARGINRSLQRIPRRGTISYVSKDESGSLTIRELDPNTRRATTLVAAVAGAKEADLAWTPEGVLLMAEKDVLYSWTRGAAAWTPGRGPGRARHARHHPDSGGPERGPHRVRRAALTPFEPASPAVNRR